MREAQEKLRRVRERVEKADAQAKLELRTSVGVPDLDPDVRKTPGDAGPEFLKGGAGAVFFELAAFAGGVDPARSYLEPALEPATYATENSAHYGQNRTPAARRQFEK